MKEFDFYRDIVRRGVRMRSRIARALYYRRKPVRVRLNKFHQQRSQMKWKNGVTEATVVGFRDDFYVKVKPDGYKTTLCYHPAMLDLIS